MALNLIYDDYDSTICHLSFFSHWPCKRVQFLRELPWEYLSKVIHAPRSLHNLIPTFWLRTVQKIKTPFLLD